MFPETMPDRAEEILRRFEPFEIPMPGQEGVPARLTFGYGIATFPTDGDDQERLLQAADSRLYAMKKQLYGSRDLR
jgi:GGDEF domain-containing protein